MSEKRFKLIKPLGTRLGLKDIFIKDTVNDWYYNEKEQVVVLLNEQQATIEQLQAKLREKEEDEKLYANEILELREANKEFIQFKELGGDY